MNDYAKPAPTVKLTLPPFAIKSYTAAELDNLDVRDDYLIKDVLVADQPAIVAGAPKTLKTSIAMDMALSMATKGMFLGKFKVHRRVRVGFMSAESGLPVLRATAHRICTAMHVDLSDIDDYFHLTDRTPKFYDDTHLSELSRWIDQNGLEVLFIDPVSTCVPGTATANLSAMYPVLQAAANVCNQAGTTLVLLHHSRKSHSDQYNRYAPMQLEELSGAGYAEWARQWILLSRSAAYQPGEHRLHMTVGGSAGHASQWAVDVSEGNGECGRVRTWSTTVLRSAEAAAERRQDQTEAKRAKASQRLQQDVEILKQYLGRAEYRDGATKSHMKQHLSGTRLDQAWCELQNAPGIVACKVRRNNRQEYDGLRLSSGLTENHSGH